MSQDDEYEFFFGVSFCLLAELMKDAIPKNELSVSVRSKSLDKIFIT